MSARRQIGKARTMSEELLKQLAQDLRPVRKDESRIYRGNERQPMISISAPGRGRFTRHAVRLIGVLAKAWRLDSRVPGALRAQTGGVPGYILMEPVLQYDERQPDQYPVRWARGNRLGYIDLLPILQPRNLEVPKGFVAELLVTLETLPNGQTYLLLHLGDIHVRPEGEIPGEESLKTDRADP